MTAIHHVLMDGKHYGHQILTPGTLCEWCEHKTCERRDSEARFCNVFRFKMKESPCESS